MVEACFITSVYCLPNNWRVKLGFEKGSMYVVVVVHRVAFDVNGEVVLVWERLGHFDKVFYLVISVWVVAGCGSTNQTDRG